MLADYIEETTTSIAGTNGDGAVTLTQITGRPRLSHAWGTATLLRYVIEDTVNGYFEQGIGSVSSNVLTRSVPRVTWNGTAYDDTNPSPLAFGSTPTSGNVKIRLAPLADAFVQSVPFHNSTASNIQDAGMMCGSMCIGASGNHTMTANLEYWFPFLWLGAGEMIQFALRVSTLAAGTNIKACLNEVNSSGSPGQKLIDFGSVSGGSAGFKATTPGFWTVTNSAKQAPGYYYVGLISDGTPTISAVSNVNWRGDILGPSSAYGLSLSRLEKSGSYATGLGSSPAGLSGSTSGTRPVVWIKPRN